MGGREAARVLAYGAGARTKNGITNAMPITVETVRNEMIAEAITKLFATRPEATEDEKLEAAMEHIWPASGRGVRERDRGAYNRDADALFAIAEGRMTTDIRTQINCDEQYQEAKANRCVISFLEIIRAKCAAGTTNAQANREALQAKLRALYMGPKLDAYSDFKNAFIKSINSLRKCIDPADFNEAEYIGKFLYKLDQDLLGDPYYKWIGPEASHLKAANSLESIYQLVDEIHDAKRTSFMMTKRPKADTTNDTSQAKVGEADVLFAETRMRKSKGGSNNGNNNNSSNSSNTNGSSGSSNSGSSTIANDTKSKKKGICEFYKPGALSSCKYGDKCNRTHILDQETYNKRKALQDQMEKLVESINK
jgi:hypothetical protein